MNENGSRGVLNAAFPEWMKDKSIKPLVKTFVSFGEGGFKVIFNKPLKCDLTIPNPDQEPLVLLEKALNEVITNGEGRLLVKAKECHKDIIISFLCMNNDLLNFNQEILIEGIKTGTWKLTLKDEEDDSNDEESEETLPQVEQKPKPVQPQKNVNPAQPKAKQPLQKEQAKLDPKKPAQAKQGPKPAKPQAQQNKGKGKQPEKHTQPKVNQQKNKPAPAKQPQAQPAKAAQVKATPKKVAKKSAVQQNNKKSSGKK